MTRLTSPLSLLVVSLLLQAVIITLRSREVAHALNTNEMVILSYTRPNALKEVEKLASKTLASEATPAISTQEQSYEKRERDHFKAFRYVTERSQDWLFDRNKFLQNRNRRAINDTNSKDDRGGYDKILANVFQSVSKIRTQNRTKLKPTTKTEPPTKALHEQVSCESSWLSCRGRCVKGRDFGQTHDRHLECYCDEHCENFTDCCYDYGHYCKKNSEFRYPIGSVNVRSNISNLWRCVSPPIKRTPSGMAGVWMITDCPHNWTDTRVRKKCNLDSPLSIDNYEANIPVIAQDGKTYKNRFCSICHGVLEDETTKFPLESSCDILPPRRYTVDKTMQFLFTYCSVSWNPPIDQQRRYCFSNVIDNCPKFAPVALRNNCKHGLTGIVCSGYGRYYSKYRNIYCAKCHYATSLVCGPPNENVYPETNPVPKPKPFSFIMNLGFSSKRQARHETKVFCPIGKVYDPHLELCRTGIESVPNQTDFDKYRVSVWIKNTTELSDWPLATSNDSKEFFRSGFTLLHSTSNSLVSNVEVEVEGEMYRVAFDIETKQHLYNTTETAPRTKKNHFKILDLFLDFTKPTSVIIHSNNFTIIKVTTRRLSCVHLQKFYQHEYVVLSEPERAVYVNRTSETFKRQEYYLTMDNNSSVDAITVCRRRLSLFCKATYTKLSSDEVTEMPNKSLIWNVGGQVYNEGSYEKRIGTVWVCTNFSSLGTKETLFEQTNHVLAIITIVGLSLSVILLSALLITYCLIGELRTLPGINLMNLSFSLILGHLLWLFGSGNNVQLLACTAIALTLHFAFLSSFVWMTIIAIDTWRAFSKKGQRINRMSNRSKRKRYLRSMAIGWLSPLAFCAICFTLDQTNTVTIGYGGTKGCWIQNTSSRSYFFAIPMGVLLLNDVVFFVLTVKAIRETVANAQMAATHRNRRNNLHVYMRIAALMGFTWVFGFLSSLHLYLSYVFVISCTLQGVYIAVAFLFTRRIAKIFIKLVRKNLSPSLVSTNVPHVDFPRVANTACHKVRQSNMVVHSLQLTNEGYTESVEYQETCL